MCTSYLYSDGCLLGHSLVHANEGDIVVQVIYRALQRKVGKDRWTGTWALSPLFNGLATHTWKAKGQATYQNILDGDD